MPNDDVPTDHLLKNTLSFPISMILMGVFCIFYGGTGCTNTQDLEKNKVPEPPSHASIVQTMVERHNFQKSDDITDSKNMELYKMIKADKDAIYTIQRQDWEIREQKRQVVYPSFEYPPTCLSIPLFFIGGALLILGVLFIFHTLDVHRIGYPNGH